MPRIVGILREEMAAGLALTGVDVIRVADAADFKRALLAVVDSREYSLAIVDEALLAGIDERTAALVAGRSLPLVIPIAAELRWKDVQAMPADDYIAMLVRRAVGYQLNIRL